MGGVNPIVPCCHGAEVGGASWHSSTYASVFVGRQQCVASILILKSLCVSGSTPVVASIKQWLINIHTVLSKISQSEI